MLDSAVQMSEEPKTETQKDQYLIFTLDSGYYGIDIKNVTEIIGIQRITPVPELPDYVQGIISLRGKIIPVIDVRIRFRMEPAEYTDRTCIIIVDIGSASVGLIVDGVSDVLSLEEGDIVDAPNMDTAARRFIRGIGRVGDEVKLLIDCIELINDEESDKLNAIAV